MPVSSKPASAVIEDVLFGYAADRLRQITPTSRFVHYTTIDAALQIIGGTATGSRALWLRNARFMNDTSEIEHGKRCLDAALGDAQLSRRFNDALHAVDPSLPPRLSDWLQRQTPTLLSDTYVLSLSMHDGPSVNEGLLSMWARYGGPNNVCLIFNPAIATPRNDIGLVLSPVLYGDANEFLPHFASFCGRLEAHASALRQIHRGLLLLNMKRAIAFAICSTKHPGFAEEREWRVLFAPEANRDVLPRTHNRFHDVEQTIYRIPLEIVGGVREAIERIIVNPQADFEAVAEQFVPALSRAGIRERSNRLIKSQIPIRA